MPVDVTTEITIDQFQEFLNTVKGNFGPYLPAGGQCNAINPVPGDWGTQPNPYDGGPPPPYQTCDAMPTPRFHVPVERARTSCLRSHAFCARS